MSWQTLKEKQENVVKVLAGSLQKERLAHAYLFEGGKGTGKSEAAFLFAKRYFCKQAEGIEPCGNCRDCRRIESGNHPDVHVIAPDGLSIKKGQITDLIHELSFRGLESRRKIYIVEHIDKMTTKAANSLLKFLEEPGEMTVAILLTEQIQRILATMRSRCQVLSFVPPAPKAIEDQMASTQATEPLRKAAARLTGDARGADRLAGDEWFAQARAIVIQFMKVLLQPTHQVFRFLQETWLPHFQDKEQVERGLDLLLLWYRDVLHILLGEENQLVYVDEREALAKEAQVLTENGIARNMTAALEAGRRLDANVSGQLVMEQCVLKIQEGSHVL